MAPRSRRGTEAAPICCTRFETAKLSRVDPIAYLAQAAERAIAHPGAATLTSDRG